MKGFKENKTLHFAMVALVLIAGMSMFNDVGGLVLNDQQPLTPSAHKQAAPINGNGTGAGRQGMKKIVEAHWQGMEVVPLTWELAAKLGIPLDEKGVLVDEVTLHAAQSGLRAKDVINGVSGVKVTDLDEFYRVTRRLRNSNKATIEVMRGQGVQRRFELLVPDFLGIAQLESAPMVLAGDIAPHRYRGPCTDCHEIGNTGQLSPDPGAITLVPPAISMRTKNPHRNRGKCTNCHVVRG